MRKKFIKYEVTLWFKEASCRFDKIEYQSNFCVHVSIQNDIVTVMIGAGRNNFGWPVLEFLNGRKRIKQNTRKLKITLTG